MISRISGRSVSNRHHTWSSFPQPFKMMADGLLKEGTRLYKYCPLGPVRCLTLTTDEFVLAKAEVTGHHAYLFEWQISLNFFSFCFAGSPCLVMEFMENGDLLSFLRHKRHANSPQDSDDEFYHSDFIKSSLSSIDLMQIALQAAHGLNFLSSQKVRDREFGEYHFHFARSHFGVCLNLHG